MDEETGVGNDGKDGKNDDKLDWKEGKISGTVYRTYTYSSALNSNLTLLHPCDIQMAAQILLA